MLQCRTGDEARSLLPPSATASTGGWSQPHKSACNCCPYGYHIDLDFVRYCEAFNNASTPSPASKLRERRRQRHSMEVLLGLTSPSVWQLEQQLPQVPQEEEEPEAVPPTSDPSNPSAAIFRDALHKAVLDFEETLQRSNRRPSPPDLSDGPLPFECFMLYGSPAGGVRRSLSTSSLSSSLSGDSSVALAPPRAFHPSIAAAAAEAAQDSDAASIGSGASGVSTAALQNIREQMARSLEKMREMEERVKIIPILQSQLAALREEKRLLLLQAKANSAERNSLDLVDVSSRVHRNLLPGDDGATARATLDERPAMRDVGVECCVLTRDVGVTHLSPKLRSVATQSSAPRPLTFSATRSETIIASSSAAASFHATELNGSLQDATKVALEIPPLLSIKQESNMKLPGIDNATNTVPPDTKHVACSTDIKMSQIYTEQEVERLIEAHGKKVSREEEALRLRRRADKAVTAKPRCSDSSVAATPRTRDAASSECTVSDLLCDKCNVRKKSIGVGSGTFPRSPSAGDDAPASLLSITMTRSKSSDSFNLRPRLIRPTSVKCTDTKDLHTFRDTGVNTMKRKLVDAGVGDKVHTRDECVETCEAYPTASNECSRCKSSSRVNSPSCSAPLVSSPSRIPRLAKPTSPASNHNGKKPFKRQDTYTKISVDNLQDSIPDVIVSDIEQMMKVTPAESKAELVEAERLPESRLKAASGSTDEACEDDGEEEEEETPLYAHCMPGGALFQMSQHKRARKKTEPSKEMKGAMKVLGDSLKKSPRSELPPQLKNAVNIIQQEWFKVSSTAAANPLDVEDYLDAFEEISGQLLEHVVNMPDNSGNTAMHYAVSHGNFDVVSILLDSKVCNINQPNQAGYTSVMLVSLALVRSDTHTQVVQRLFQLADVNVRAKQHGQTALMLAASHGRLRMANMLLAAGADVNIQDEDGSTALMCAAEHGHTEMVRLLLAQPDCDVSTTDHDGSTALNIAMEAGHRDVGVLLYAHQHFSSRGSSPYSSLKSRRPKS